MESHMIHITQRAHMSLTGLEKVISMEPELVEVETTADHLAIKGQNLHAEKLDMENYQGNAVVNYTDFETPFTRIIEHKHFEFNKCKGTVITKEYPQDWKKGDEAYYPVNDEKNNNLFAKYQELAGQEKNVIFGGRLGNYKYYDMDKVIKSALEKCKEVLEKV